MNSYETFDLIGSQQVARETKSAEQLFFIWEEVCRLYDMGRIGKYELEEMKAVVYPNLHNASSSESAADTSVWDEVVNDRFRSSTKH